MITVYVYKTPGLRIEVKAPAEEAEWVRLLFERHPTPFRVLRDIGYEPIKPNEKA